MSPPTPLENLSGPSGSLKAEPPDAAEIASLLRTGSTRLTDATNATLGLSFGGCWTCVTTSATWASTKA